MAATKGSATVDFGTLGKWEASVAVTGQTGILSGSFVEAWISPVASADHSADEHRVETIAVTAGDVVASTGFTIWAKSTGRRPLFGRWTIQWVWS